MYDARVQRRPRIARWSNVPPRRSLAPAPHRVADPGYGSDGMKSSLRSLALRFGMPRRRFHRALRHRGRVSAAPVGPHNGSRVLVAGWFSWKDAHATAGDTLARDVACEWLARAGIEHDVANAPQFGPGVDWRSVDPELYSDVVFVCGPVGPATPIMSLLQRFSRSRMIGLDVTMLEDLDVWNPFHVLLERDSALTARPDLAFLSDETSVPVVGVVLVEPYEPEYPDRDRQTDARQAVDELLDGQVAAHVRIDTRLVDNEGGLRTPAQVESLIKRMDAIVTTRLHGLVLGLKNGVPALAIDPVAGGSKIQRQAAAIGWPLVRTADRLEHHDLKAVLDLCLSDRGRQMAAECRLQASMQLQQVRDEFLAAVGTDQGRGGEL